jgi:hypothetical protein
VSKGIRFARFFCLILPLMGCSDLTGPDDGDAGIVGTWYMSEVQTGLKTHGSSGWVILWESPTGDSALVYWAGLQVRDDRTCTHSLTFQWWETPRGGPLGPGEVFEETLSFPCRVKVSGSGKVRDVVFTYATRDAGTFQGAGSLWYKMSHGMVSQRVYGMSLQLPPAEVLLDRMTSPEFQAVLLGSVLTFPSPLPVVGYDQGITIL